MACKEEEIATKDIIAIEHVEIFPDLESIKERLIDIDRLGAMTEGCRFTYMWVIKLLAVKQFMAKKQKPT